MSTTAAIADWITRVADDERKRDDARARQNETVARRAELVGRSGRRLFDDLCATVIRDVDAFRHEFAGDPGRDIVVEATAPDATFVVRKPPPTAVSLVVTLNLEAATLACQYRFMLENGLPPREERMDVVLADDGGGTLRMKRHTTGQIFATADALSEFLLVPVLTGRSR